MIGLGGDAMRILCILVCMGLLAACGSSRNAELDAQKQALRAQSRRKQYEQEAVTMLENSQSTDSAWDQMAPLLDAGLTQLSVKDHEAIVLRFFQGKTFPEIAATVGSTEEGVRKRVDRAVEKLRRFFSEHGLAIPAAVLVSELATRAVQSSPPSLASQINVSGPAPMLSPLVAETLNALRWKSWRLPRAPRRPRSSMPRVRAAPCAPAESQGPVLLNQPS